MKTLFSLGLLASSLLSTAESTEKMDDVVVTATRTETNAQKLAASVTVITKEDIANKQPSSLADLLRSVPGLSVKNDGPHSITSGVYIRGMRKYHTKVMINGVALQDTSTPQTTAIISSISLSDIERIEIIRGASSTLYGSNAMGGVINIITRKAEEDAFSGELGVEAGSHGWQKYSALVSGKKGNFDYLFSSEWLSENGISNKTVTSDNDTYRSLALNGEVGYQITDNLRLSLFGLYNDTDQEYDTEDFFLGTIEQGELHHELIQLGTALDAKNIIDGIFDSSLKFSYSRTKRAELESPQFYMGKTLETDWQNTININDSNRLVLGMTYTEEKSEADSFGASNHDRYRTDAYFAQYETEPVNDLFITAGLRHNNHSEFGGETTYSASAAYLIESTGTKLKATWGTGYRAPSLYELNDPFGGDPNLTPETSESWDIGFEQTVNEKVEFGVSYFENRVSDYIEYPWWDFIYQYVQVSGIKIHGVESYITFKPTDNVNLHFTHTWQHSNNMDQDVSPIIYLPDNKFTADLNWQVNEKLNLNLNGVYVDKRKTDYTGGKTLHGYTLLNVAANYQLTDSLEITGRINNILDKDYQESVGYETYGITAYAGLKYRF